MTDRLAIHGGRPVRPGFLPYGRHRLTDEDRASVLRALDAEWLTGGPVVGEFEAALAALAGSAYAVAVSSGTAALHLAAIALGVGPGADVITSPLTFVASANTALFCGARPRFADVDPSTLTMDPSDLEVRMDPEVRVVVPVHFAGQPCDMDGVVKAARESGAFVLEDGAHALGARYRGRRVGSLGDAAVFSFHPVKHITTFEGGAVVTSDGDLAARIRRLRNHGIDQEARRRTADTTWWYAIRELGYNYRLSDVACALGLSQLQRIDRILHRRRILANRYLKGLNGLGGVSAPAIAPDVEHAWHIFPVLLDPGIDRGWVFRALRAENIGVNVHYLPVHLFDLYRRRFGFDRGDFPVAEGAYERLLTLPLFDGMSDGDVADTLAALEKVLSHV